MANNAISVEDVSAVVGYLLDTEDFSVTSPNLPQSLIVLCEANDASQGTLDLTPKKVTSAQQAGQLYGFGSPAYLIMRILQPIFGGGLGGIPITFSPQAKAGGATPKIVSITPSGVATGNGTHTIQLSGRGVLDGQSFNIAVSKGDTTHDITPKIADAINSVLGAPAIGTDTAYQAELQTKWSGLTANDFNVVVNTNGNDLGLSYIVSTVQAGSGTPSVTTALAGIGNVWDTGIVNSYGLVNSVVSALESWNGIPDPVNPTGRFVATVGKPAVAISGSLLEDPSAYTASHSDQVTIAVAPAPLSLGFAFEAAANMMLVWAKIAQETPELDVSGTHYPDMPTPAYIGAMSNYDNRNSIMQAGCSTVDLDGGAYLIKDFVTTYAPAGVLIPEFRYVRTLYQIDMNVKYTYQLREKIVVTGKVIANDNDILQVTDYVKPKMWKSELNTMATDLVGRGLIVDAPFMQANTTVVISSTNPNRFNSVFKYKRSGVALISSTTAIAGFNYGTLN